MFPAILIFSIYILPFWVLNAVFQFTVLKYHDINLNSKYKIYFFTLSFFLMLILSIIIYWLTPEEITTKMITIIPVVNSHLYYALAIIPSCFFALLVTIFCSYLALHRVPKNAQ